jgi:hypothetical protein
MTNGRIRPSNACLIELRQDDLGGLLCNWDRSLLVLAFSVALVVSGINWDGWIESVRKSSGMILCLVVRLLGLLLLFMTSPSVPFSLCISNSFVAEPWGPCSQTCGEGVRQREVNCKIFLEFTRTVANLPDKECFGPKPLTSESCFARPCPSPT